MALLERSPRGSRPTEAGALVAEWARQVIAAAEALDAGLGALRERRDGRLRVVASLTVAEYLMPGWLVTLKTVRPGVAVTLRTANSTVVAEEVRGGDADLGFVEGARTPAGLSGTVVATDRLVVVVGAGHAWARRRSGVTAAELAATPSSCASRARGRARSSTGRSPRTAGRRPRCCSWRPPPRSRRRPSRARARSW